MATRNHRELAVPPPSGSLTIADVGARGGLHKRWRHCAAPVIGVGFEADPDECRRLNEQHDDGMTYLPYALGAEDGRRATLYLTAARGASSLLQPNREVLDQFPYGAAITVTRTLPLTLTSLDTACARHRIVPDVVKLDVQGAELDVLHGASGILARAALVETEVEFQALYTGQPLFRDVDAFFAARGWMLLGLRRDYWRRGGAPTADGGTLTHGDALYVNPARLAELTAETAGPVLAALAAYRQADFANVLARRVSWPGAVSELTPRAPWAQRIAGAILSRLVSHRAVRAFVDGCRPATATDWHDPDDFF